MGVAGDIFVALQQTTKGPTTGYGPAQDMVPRGAELKQPDKQVVASRTAVRKYKHSRAPARQKTRLGMPLHCQGTRTRSMLTTNMSGTRFEKLVAWSSSL